MAVLMSLVGLWILVVFVWNPIANRRYVVLAKELAAKPSAAEVAFEHCVRSRYREFSAARGDIMVIKGCLEQESAKSPFSVSCNQIGFHNVDSFPRRWRNVAEVNGVSVGKFQDAGRELLFVSKTVKYQFTDKEVEVEFRFVMDPPK